MCPPETAQHAFHHLEEHFETTPLKYFFKRFGTGEDKEEASKVGFDRDMTRGWLMAKFDRSEGGFGWECKSAQLPTCIPN